MRNQKHLKNSPSRSNAIYTRDADLDLATRTFQVRAETVNEEARSVDAVIATEAPVRVFDYNRGEIVHEVLRMDGCDLPASGQIPLLDTHNRWSIDGQLGSCRNLRIEATALLGANTFARTPGGDAAFALVRDGHLTDNSVGYRVAASTYIEAGETAEVDGRSFTAAELPLKVCTRWSPHENSVCPIGADADAKNRAAHTTTPPTRTHGKDTNMKKFKEWLKARGLDYDALDENQRAALRVDYDAEVTRAATPPAEPPAPAIDPDVLARAISAEMTARTVAAADQRRTQITDLAVLAGVSDETRDAAIEDPETTVASARAAFRDELRAARPGVPAVHVPPSASAADGRTIEAALMVRGNLDNDLVNLRTDRRATAVVSPYTDQILDAGNRLRGMSMEDLCRHALRIEGIEIPLGTDAMIQRAISTGSFGEITSNVAGVAALKGALSVAQTWRAWCSIGEVRNFQANKLVRLDLAGNLSPVGVDGKLAHINLEDTGESITAATRGNILVITRQTIRDDRIGIMTRAPQELGQGAMQDVSHTVYTLLLANGTMSDGAAIFVDATHGNLKTSCTLGPAGIQTAAAALAAQNNAKGLPRDLIPAVVLVPPGQYSDAWSSVKQPLVIASSPSTSVGTTVPAVHAYGDGSINPVMESRLANTSYTGYSATDWYLMASPAQCDNVQVAFLDGVQTPTVRLATMEAGVLATAIEVYFDYGVAAADHQGMVKCTE